MTPWIEITELKCRVSCADRAALVPLVHDVLFEYMARQCALGEAEPGEPMTISVGKAMEVMEAQSPRWRERLANLVSPLQIGDNPLPKRTQELVDDLLSEAHSFYRREGADSWLAATKSSDQDRRFKLLWSDFFAARLLDWLQQRELTTDPDSLELADALVECAKRWIQFAASICLPGSEPAQIFPSSEQELVLSLRRGPLELRVRGNGAPCIQVKGSDAAASQVIQFILADQHSLESAIMQLLLNMELQKSDPDTEGSLSLLVPRQNEQAARFEPGVESAFQGFVGNPSVIRRLKGKINLTRGLPARKLSKPLLILGGTSCGKSELASRIARGLKVPLVEVSGAFVRKPDDLMHAIRRDVFQELDSPFVLAVDHPQHWKRNASEFLSLLDDANPSLVSTDAALALPQLTLIFMAHSLTQLPDPFLSRIQCVELESCTESDVSNLVDRYFHTNRVQIAADVPKAIARMAKLVPGRALDYARDVAERQSSTPRTGQLTAAEVQSLAPRLWRVDELGLNQLDYLYLQALETGPRGLPALQQLLPVSADEIMLEVEPYLMEIGCVQRTPKGRSLTAWGETLIHRHRSKQEAAAL